jgi:precorrin-2 methylase
MSVKSFLLAPNGPGLPVPIRRTISATDLSFELEVAPGPVKAPQGPTANNEFALTDIEQSPSTAQTPTTKQKLSVLKTVFNPKTNRSETRYAKVLESNQKQGETVYYASGFESLEEFIAAIKSS